MDQDQDPSLFSLSLDFQSTATLKSAASWARVLAILGFVMAVLLIITGVAMPSMMGQVQPTAGYGDEIGKQGMKMAGTMGMVIYVIMGGLYGLSSFFIFSFANKISLAFKTNDQVALNAGFTGARNYFAFWTILLMIFLLFMLIGLAAMMAVPK